MNLLEVAGLTKRFGGVLALDGITMSVRMHEIVGLIGPNGAGKTTLFNCISGFIPCDSGRILFGESGISIGERAPHEVARLGIARTFQNIKVFPGMTVLENVMAGRYLKTRSGIFSAILRPAWVADEEELAALKAEEWLEFVGLLEEKDLLSGSLSHGDRRRLEIARALASEPLLLQLDEPAAGMNPRETEELKVLIGRIRDLGVSVFLIEHDMSLVMGVCDRVVVLDYGEKIAEGSPEAIQNNQAVIEAYLGREDG